MASQRVNSNEVNPQISCFQQVKESKLTDVALITGCVVLSLIAILVSAGVIDFMGATYLSYALYATAAIFLLAELIKIAIKCCNKKPDSNVTNVTSVVP